MYFIRRARKEDAQDIHDAHMRSIREICSKENTVEEISGWGNRPFNKDQRIAAIENHFVWVVEINKKIEGYAQIVFKEIEEQVFAHIFGLYLSSNALGLGVGRKFIELMIEEAKTKKVSRITLESTITAHKFYQKFEFVDTGDQITVQIGESAVRCQPMKLEF